VPAESLRYHAEQNHFSNWLKARTEFLLAYKLRPQKVSDYQSIEDIRGYLIRCLRDLRTARQQGNIVDFDPRTFDPRASFARIGGGSLGGKGRGLAFVNSIIYANLLQSRFDGVRISVPPTVVIGTDVFDQFINENDLWRVALKSSDEKEIEKSFVDAAFPAETTRTLRKLLEIVRYPLSVRSSSLLEDSRYQPFAGSTGATRSPTTTATSMRGLEELVTAIKRVYASTFSHCAKSYIKATPYRLEEEKDGGDRPEARWLRPFGPVLSGHFGESAIRTTTIPPGR